MPYLNYFAHPGETRHDAHDRLTAAYYPLILKITTRKAERHADVLCRPSDLDNILRIAQFALWEANDDFNLDRNGAGRNPEDAFTAFATKTITDRLTHYIKIHYTPRKVAGALAGNSPVCGYGFLDRPVSQRQRPTPLRKRRLPPGGR